MRNLIVPKKGDLVRIRFGASAYHSWSEDFRIGVVTGHSYKDEDTIDLNNDWVMCFTNVDHNAYFAYQCEVVAK